MSTTDLDSALQSSYPSSSPSYKTENSSSPHVASSRAIPYPPPVTSSPRRTRSATFSTRLRQKTQDDTTLLQTPSLPSDSRSVRSRPDDEGGILITEYRDSQQSPFRSFRIKPPTLQLKDACEKATPQRTIIWRKNSPWVLRNEWNRGATILQAIGQEQSSPCNCCILGRGPFEQCVNFPGINERPEIAKGACANCLWSSHARRCSFRPDCSWEVGSATRIAVPHSPARKKTVNNTPIKATRSSSTLSSPSVIAYTSNTRISRHKDYTDKKEREDEDVTDAPIGQSGASTTHNEVADTSDVAINQSNQDHSLPNGAVNASDSSAPASNLVPPSCNGIVAGGDNHNKPPHDGIVGTPEVPVPVDLVICDPPPCNGTGNPSRASIELSNYNTPHLNGIIDQSSMTASQPTKHPTRRSPDLPLGQDSHVSSSSSNNQNKHDRESSGAEQKSPFQTPGAFKGHEFIVFPDTLNPNDESAIERALAEARAICGRLELRLDKLRAVSWDSDST